MKECLNVCLISKIYIIIFMVFKIMNIIIHVNDDAFSFQFETVQSKTITAKSSFRVNIDWEMKTIGELLTID